MRDLNIEVINVVFGIVAMVCFLMIIDEEGFDD